MIKKVLIGLLFISIGIGILIFMSIHANSQKEGTITVGAKDYTEQYILGEMLAQLIENNTNLNVERKFGYPIEEIDEAFMAGEIDLYPEYTGTAWDDILKKDFVINHPDILYTEVSKVYEEELDTTWLGRYGFNNSYGLAMRSEEALDKGILTYTDLALKSAPLSIGGESSFFNRPNAYPGLKDAYGFNFDEVVVLPIEEKYDALDEQAVDVIDIFTTDGHLEERDLIVLEDDRQYFSPYEAATIIKNETLEQYPELYDVLNVLEGQISNEDMARLNYLVDIGGENVEDVARLFLVSKGLIE